MPGLSPVSIILIIAVILLLFGAQKLPDLARSVGRSMRIFKSEVNEMTNESKAREETKSQGELTQGSGNDQSWQDPQSYPQQGNAQQGYPPQQHWGPNPQGGYPQQQNWGDPQQGNAQQGYPPQQHLVQPPSQQTYPGQHPNQGSYDYGNYGSGNHQQGNNNPQQPQQ